jgi:stage V sporulation protein G
VEITEVRIKLMEDNSGSNERLQAFCSITFDDMFVIRDLKIIEGAKGFFVAMPSRKLTDRCTHCGTKNHLRSRFCNQCGSRLDENRALRDAEGRAKLHADIAHPINSACREKIQGAVLAAYAEELERSKLPGYVSRYDEFDAGEDYDTNPYGTPLPAGQHVAAGEPPLRRGGPLRSHTQHNRPGQSVLRGPHSPQRSSHYHQPASPSDAQATDRDGFGTGL